MFLAFIRPQVQALVPEKEKERTTNRGDAIGSHLWTSRGRMYPKKAKAVAGEDPPRVFAEVSKNQMYVNSSHCTFVNASKICSLLENTCNGYLAEIEQGE